MADRTEDRREQRITQGVWDAARAEVFGALNGARYEDGGKVLSTEDASVLTGRVMSRLNPDCAECGAHPLGCGWHFDWCSQAPPTGRSLGGES